MKRTLGIWSIAALLACHTAVRAEIIMLTSRSAFEAALSSSTSINFESVAAGTYFTPIVQGDATFTNQAANPLIVQGPGIFGNPSKMLSTQFSGANGIRTQLTTPYGAFGSEFGYVAAASGTMNYSLATSTGPITGQFGANNVGFFNGANATFVGWIGTAGETISEVRISGNTANFEAMDNVIFGTPTPVPEPASFAFAGAAALAFAGRVWRRRRAG